MKRQYISVALTLLAVLLLAVACTNKDQAAGVGQVKASSDYIDAFGQPPVPKQGECLARVGYFPLRTDPNRLRPLPFFLFGERDPLAQLLDRLAGGVVPLDFDADLFNPFPAESTLLVGERRDGSVVIDLQLSGPDPSPEALQAIAAVVTETASQFDDIASVVIRWHGQSLPGMPAGGFVHDPARIQAPGSPVLFMVAGAWEPDAAGPDEVVANFDRPVTIAAFRLEDASGKKLEGNYYQSAFDMSVVLHPADPSAFVEGMPLTASWEVTDALGRNGSGTKVFPLLRREHVDAR